MGASCFDDLARHVGHHIEVVLYGGVNAAVECTDCNEVITDFDKYSEDDPRKER